MADHDYMDFRACIPVILWLPPHNPPPNPFILGTRLPRLPRNPTRHNRRLQIREPDHRTRPFDVPTTEDERLRQQVRVTGMLDEMLKVQDRRIYCGLRMYILVEWALLI
ncbi:hypothetical protein DPV78_012643 [Talaromyces pinophilus]|nr:hypothetical protein DPV78_012643 [Talaromyces pinophilus]